LKTRLALHFPNPFVVDMEAGTDHYGSEFQFRVSHTKDPDLVMEIVDELLTTNHNYRTLIIDPITVYWQELQDKYANIFLQREKRSPGFKFEYYKIQASDWNIIKRELHRFINKLMMLDMNVIVIAHQKKMYSDASGDFMKVIGDTFDGEKSLPYQFDTVVHTFKDSNTKAFKGECLKDRTHCLKEGVFDLSYEAFEGTFGKESLEAKAKPVEFLTDEQKDKIETYLVMFEIETAKANKRFREYGAETIDELTKENAALIIEKFDQAAEKRKEKQNATS